MIAPYSCRLHSDCQLLPDRVRARRAIHLVAGGIVRRAGNAARDSRSGNDGLTIFAAMKLANTSFIHTSLNQRIVTRSPNHMCDGLVRDDAGAIEHLVLRRGFVEQQPGGVVENRARVLHAAELKRRDQHEVELAERIRDAPCSLRASRARSHAGRRSRRGCARPSPRRSRDGTCGTSRPLRVGRFDLEFAGGEREEVGRQWLRLGEHASRVRRLLPCSRDGFGSVRHRLPVVRHIQRQACTAPSDRAGRSRETRAARGPARTACRGSRRCGSAPRHQP